LSDYLDASVLVSLFVDDVHSPRALAFEAQDPDVVTSAWAIAEFSSALSFQMRLGRLTRPERDKAEGDLDSWLARQPDPVVIVQADFFRSRDILQVSAYRCEPPMRCTWPSA
jgi:predicted nucleic acid-binding protein